MTIDLCRCNCHAIGNVPLSGQHRKNAVVYISYFESMEASEAQLRIDEDHVGIDVHHTEDGEKSAEQHNIVQFSQIETEKWYEVRGNVGQNLSIHRDRSLHGDVDASLR